MISLELVKTDRLYQEMEGVLCYLNFMMHNFEIQGGREGEKRRQGKTKREKGGFLGVGTRPTSGVSAYLIRPKQADRASRARTSRVFCFLLFMVGLLKQLGRSAIANSGSTTNRVRPRLTRTPSMQLIWDRALVGLPRRLIGLSPALGSQGKREKRQKAARWHTSAVFAGIDMHAESQVPLPAVESWVPRPEGDLQNKPPWHLLWASLLALQVGEGMAASPKVFDGETVYLKRVCWVREALNGI